MSFFTLNQVSRRGPIEFPLFSKCPPEVQQRIWAAAVANEPRRIITVDIDSSCLKHPPQSTDQYGREFPSIDHRYFILSAKAPKICSLLTTCQKSRIEALKAYCPSFHNVFKNPVLIDFQKDVLLFKSNYAMTQIRWDIGGGKDLARVTALAIHATGSSPNDVFPEQRSLYNVFKGFRNVAIAVLVDPRPDWMTFVATGRAMQFGNQQQLQNYLFPMAVRPMMEQRIPHLCLMTKDKFLEWVAGA